MQGSLVKKAAEEFANGNYAAALELYHQLSSQLGELFFRANIALCEKKLQSNLHKATRDIGTLQDIRVAAVMDEFTYVSYRDTCQLLNLSIDNWEGELTQFAPDFLFIESAWRGKDDAWNRKISQASPELLGILDWCKQNKVPTMFWNKEDPVHYGTFLHTAKRFDFVFTTDLNCIGPYKRDLRHDRVYLLPFACNPVEHNPIEKYERKRKACFAGSYYVRYPERTRDLDVLLETFLEISGVDIYDRQYGKNDENYAFPEKYQALILGNLKYEQIDLAYKGYQYGINLNSVKYSATMFARRVYELMACNTLVISNYSKGVRMLFGDLVVCSDDKTEVLARLQRLESSPEYATAVKLAGVRKVLTEHTYENRFTDIAGKVLGYRASPSLPEIHVVARVHDIVQLEVAIATFHRQSHARKVMHVLTDSRDVMQACHGDANAMIIASTVRDSRQLRCVEGSHVAFIDPRHYYGDDYLTDLAVATKYARADVIAKPLIPTEIDAGSAHYKAHAPQYSYGDSFYLYTALVAVARLKTLGLAEASTKNDCVFRTAADEVFYIDPYSFVPASQTPAANTQRIAHTGLAMAELMSHADRIPRSLGAQISPFMEHLVTGRELHGQLDIVSAKKRGITCTAEGDCLKIDTAPNAESPYYIYTSAIPLESLWPDQSGKFYLETTPGLELSPVILYQDELQNRITHAISIPNWNQVSRAPPNACYVRLGIRVSGGPGHALVRNWVFDHVPDNHRFAWIGSNTTLLVSPGYPNYMDYYRYAFVHRRVKNYKEGGLEADVFRFRHNGDLSMYEFENVDVISGGIDVLNTVVESKKYSTIVIHALDHAMWSIVSRYRNSRRIVIWLHGAEIQSWKRRLFNYTTQVEIDNARWAGEARDEMWKEIFSLNNPNIHFVFVSNQFFSEVKEDLMLPINPEQVHIISNPIDANLFQHHKKHEEQRKHILSIRPYASKVYANDLMVKTVLELSERPYFNELKFLIVGDGVLFEETVAPLQGLENVQIFKGFLSQAEIAALHREYGVFLCPSRMDTQGVSRDEAMSSGLVPVTNAVGAIPEFLDKSAGFVCEPENFLEMAECIDRLYHDPDLFMKLSARAAAAIRETRSANIICPAEMRLIRGEST